MRILVADDSKTSLAAITYALKNLGHLVTPVASGVEAVESAKSSKPDLIILDVVMDVMDGYECAKQIRQIYDEEEWIPIIFLSASVDDASIAKGIDAGGDDYITKPFSDVTLAAKLKAMQRIADMRKRLYDAKQQLYQLSSTDTLTGTNNRLQFERVIKRIINDADQFGKKVALMFIDIDNFKSVNDSFGHQVGDKLLVEVAERLKGIVRATDFIARIGGDEFVVVLMNVTNEKDVTSVAQSILRSLSCDYNIEGRVIRNSVSIGIATYPSKDTNIENFVLNADIAMYHAKTTGRHNFKFYTSDLNEVYKHKLSIEHDLKFALDRNQLYLTYQPIYDLTTMKIKGLEALLCWKHPQLGLISPNIFIPIAEERGLIIAIGNWVIDNACREIASLDDLRKNKDFKVCVNISSKEFYEDEFYHHVKNVIHKHKLDPIQVELELTETAVISCEDAIFMNTMKKIHDYGIKISIDDFGTGYSSLIHLKSLPVDTLKIEKCFVQDLTSTPNSEIIVKCLIALGKNLNLQVIAEGIETEAQLKFLIANGCKYGQGYYLNKPMTIDKIAEIVGSDKEKSKDKITKET